MKVEIRNAVGELPFSLSGVMLPLTKINKKLVDSWLKLWTKIKKKISDNQEITLTEAENLLEGIYNIYSEATTFKGEPAGDIAVENVNDCFMNYLNRRLDHTSQGDSNMARFISVYSAWIHSHGTSWPYDLAVMAINSDRQIDFSVLNKVVDFLGYEIQPAMAQRQKQQEYMQEIIKKEKVIAAQMQWVSQGGPVLIYDAHMDDFLEGAAPSKGQYPDLLYISKNQFLSEFPADEQESGCVVVTNISCVKDAGADYVRELIEEWLAESRRLKGDDFYQSKTVDRYLLKRARLVAMIRTIIRQLNPYVKTERDGGMHGIAVFVNRVCRDYLFRGKLSYKWPKRLVVFMWVLFALYGIRVIWFIHKIWSN